MPNRFNPLDYPIAFQYPERNSPVFDWWGHIPFAGAIVSALRPKLLVELGVYRGDSFCAFSQAVRTLGLSTKVIGIDAFIGDENTGPQAEAHIAELFAFVEKHYKFAELRKAYFDDVVDSFEPDSIDLIHIDGCHRTEAVQNDFDRWLPKLAPEGVMLFHDIALGGAPHAGVDVFWTEIKKHHPYFEFSHNWGLGVLAPKRVPPALEGFFAAVGTPDEEKIQTYFNLHGARTVVAMRYRQHYGDTLLLQGLSDPALCSDPSQFNLGSALYTFPDR